MANLDRTFDALGDPTRRRVIELLRRPQRASEVAHALGLTRPAISRHLRVLRASGLIEDAADEQDGRARVLRLRREAFGELRDWLEDVEQFWTLELAAFKQHAERTRGKKRGAPGSGPSASK